MYYRLVLILLLIFVFVAYIDTKSLHEKFNDEKILREYNHSSKIIGIGLKEKNGNFNVKDVIENTPADKSGIEIGDILVKIDGKKITSISELKKYLNNIKQNKKIALTIKKPNNSIIEVEILPFEFSKPQ